MNSSHAGAAPSVPARGRLVVCEPRGEWAIQLRSAAADTDVQVFETRFPQACFHELQTSPESLVAWDASTERLVHQLLKQQQLFPQSVSIVLATRAQWPSHWLWREAGAVHVVGSTRELPAALRLIRRHLQAVAPPSSMDEAIWRALPWPEDG